MKRRRSLYARPAIIRGQQCAEAPAGRRRVTLPLSGHGGGQALLALSVLLSCPGADRPGGVWPAETAPQRSGRSGRLPCRRSPWVSTNGCPPNRLPRPGSGRPAVRCPPVRGPVSGDLVSAVRLVTSVSSASARRWPPGSRWCGGAACTPGTDRGAGGLGVPSGLVEGPSRPGGGDGVEVVGGPVGERRSRTWPGRARPLTGQEEASPGRGPTSSTVRMGAAPARPSQEVSEPGSATTTL
jgi:hypothetical protein